MAAWQVELKAGVEPPARKLLPAADGRHDGDRLPWAAEDRRVLNTASSISPG